MPTMWKPIVALVALVLAACPGVTASPKTQLALACQTYASTLAVVANYRSVMSAGEEATVEAVIEVAAPVCENLSEIEEGIEATSALRKVRDAVRRLETVEESYVD